MSEPSPIIFSGPDSGSRSAGDMLKAAREGQGLSLERLAGMIKVTVTKLDDLEQGRYDRLPDANFTRALAMTVCRALKLDPTEVLAALPAARTMPLAPDKPPLNQPFKDGRLSGAPLFERQFDWSTVLSLKWVAPAVLLLAAAAIPFLPDSLDIPGWIHRGAAHWLTKQDHIAQPPSTPVSSAPAPAAEASSAAGESGEAAQFAASAVEFAPKDEAVPKVVTPGAKPLVLDAPDGYAASAVTGAASTQMQAPSAAGASTGVVGASLPGDIKPSQMVLEARQPSWVEVRDARGTKLISRQLQSGEKVPVEGMAPLKLVIGYAPGIHVSFRGQDVDLTRYTQSNVARLELK